MAQTRLLFRLFLAIAALGLAPASALAQGPVSQGPRAMTIGLTATVGLYCRIEQVGQPVFTLVDGRASLGPVHEICNAPTGYVVTTSFTNLAAGRLLVGGAGSEIVEGLAIRAVNHADAVTNLWSLDAARATDTAQPVVVTITISPT